VGAAQAGVICSNDRPGAREEVGAVVVELEPVAGARPLKPWWHPSLLLAPVASFAFFAVGVLALGWAPALILLGFWLEEVLQLLVCGVAVARLERARGEGGSVAGVLVLLFFPLVHLIFIVIFMFVDSSHNPATDLLLEDLVDLLSGDLAYMERGTILALLQVAGFAAAGTIAEAVRRRRARARDPEIAELELATRMKQALALPHLTILAGGGVMMAAHSSAGLAVGLVVGKAVVELLLFPAMRRSVQKEIAAKAARRAAG